MHSARLTFGLVVVLLSARAGAAHAQLPPLTVPKGYVRFDLGGAFTGYDERYRLGQRQDAAQDFMREALGSDFFPALAGADSLIASITGLSSPLSLGRTSASHLVTFGTGILGAAVGVTSRLTVFGMVPLRVTKVRATFTQDSATANAGFNPADQQFGSSAGGQQDAAFFSEFDAALVTLEQNLASGVYDGDPNRKALAAATLAEGGALRENLFALLLGAGTASPFLPTTTSAAGAAILQRVAALQGILSNRLDVLGFSQVPALPGRRLDNTDFGSFVTDPQGPVAGSLETPELFSLGNIELGAAYSVIDQLAEPGVRSGIRVAAQLLTRLRTGTDPDPARFFAVGTAERQPDVEGSVTADLLHRRFGARVTAGYNLQMTGTVERRISEPSQPMPYASRLATVTWNPGDELILGASPFFRLTSSFALVAGATYRRKGSDSYDLAAGQDSIPDAPPSLLGIESDASWTTASLGLSYSTVLTPREGRSAQAPLDAGLMWSGVVAANGGRVPRSSSLRLWLRLYGKLW
ncbi:MAG: hypothetical protein H6R40_232 [Gemmatimonadetes bacterium]|nr:hypothetical protein [Gemmatimonadota bacterium]